MKQEDAALEALNQSKLNNFAANLEQFKNESSHSGLYPTTKKIAAAIGITLLISLGIVLVSLVSIGLINLIVVPVLLGVFSSPMIWNAYDDIYKAKKHSLEIYQFFSCRDVGETIGETSSVPLA